MSKLLTQIQTPNFKALILILIKIKTPKGTPTILPKVNLFTSIKSISFLIFKINDIEIIKDKIVIGITLVRKVLPLWKNQDLYLIAV